MSSKLLPLGLVAIAYLYVFPHQPRINNPNENVRFYMTAAIVEEGRYEIDTMRTRWGWVNDASTRDGHYYSVKAPGASILAIPGYAAYRALCAGSGRTFDRQEALWFCRLTATILPVLLWLWPVLSFFRARCAEPALADGAFFALALGTPVFGYTMMLASHATSAVAAFGAFMLLCDARRKAHASHLQAFGAGALTAATTWLEYQGIIASVVLVVYGVATLWPRGGFRALPSFALGGLLPTLSSMHFQHHAFGDAFSPGHLSLETTAFRSVHSQGFYGVVGVDPLALRTLLIDLGQGLFPLAPLLALGVLGMLAGLRRRETRAEAACGLGVVALTVLAMASTTYWRGGWTVGPRYLVLTMPFLAFYALAPLGALARWRSELACGLAAGLLACGMIASGLPSAYYPHLPPEFSRPLPQLFAVLLAEGYAPYNAGRLVGLRGSASMLPLAIVAALALGLTLRGPALRVPAGQRMRSLASALVVSLLVGAASMTPLWIRPQHEPGVAKAVAFVKRYWSPEPTATGD